MNFYKNHRALVSVAISALCLGLLVFLFSNNSTAGFMENMGLKFTKVEDIQRQFFPAPEKTKVIAKAKPKVVLGPHKVTAAEQQKIDTLKSRLNYLENFAITKDNTALDVFFASLAHTGDSTVHIWYYGDSQIEGDRVTGELRDMLQGRFGGNGAGYVPFSDLATFRYFELKTGPSLYKLNCFVNKSRRGFGFAGKVYKFNQKDSAFSPVTGIWISPKLRYSKLYLMYGQHGGGSVKVYGADSTPVIVKIPVETVSGRVQVSQKTPHGTLRFALPANGNYFGLMFDGDKGIQIDNCGIRGHSGDGLNHITDEVLLKEATTWNTKLVIFHFGNNMIPVIKGGQKNMDYYSRYFQNIFSRYRRLFPNVSFLVISAGDMGTVFEGEEVAYPNVPEFVECMRRAAINSGCAFFDAHAMIAKDGGIIGWKKYGYAGLDGHLTPSGQRRFASNIYSELMREYEVYQIIHQAQ